MTNPLIEDLSFPPISICLPTSGYWYDDGVVDPIADPLDLEVKPIGILAEQNFRDPWLLASGKAIPRLIKEVCPAILQPEELAEVDIEAILLATRLASYGDMMKLTHKCQYKNVDAEGDGEGCDEENELDLNIQEFITRYDQIRNFEDYMVELAAVAHKVYLRPTPYKQSLQVLRQAVKAEQTFRLFDDMTAEDFVMDSDKIGNYTQLADLTSDVTVSSIVESISYVTTVKGEKVYDKSTIREWLLAMPTTETKLIVDKINELALPLRQRSEVKYNCHACGFENKFLLELDPQRLFMQAEDSEQQKKPSPESKGTVKKKKRRLVK